MTQITLNALFQRVKRRLLKENNEVLRKCREGKWRYELGEYYTIDNSSGGILRRDVDLLDLAKEVGIPVVEPENQSLNA